jgi:sulfate permease, SulP family
LAALLLLTASRLIYFKRLASTLRASRMDAGVVAVTAPSAVAFGLDMAILIGVAPSIALFVPRAAKLKVTELVVDADDVVREKLAADPADAGFMIFDMEGELFAGAATELERTFARIERAAREKRIHHVLLRLERARNPDVVSLEHFEHFLRRARVARLSVWLAGVQSDLLDAFGRLHVVEWLQPDRIFRQGADEDSATLAAIRRIRSALPEANAATSDRLFYLV